ncbi:MAG: hypothetical protein Fur006_61000 [Coleofasciculaceae cyanobacterium]
MTHSLTYTTDFRGLHPEEIWLEPEHFEQASQLSNQVSGEAHQWQTYVNMLALLGFLEWLNERVGDLPVDREQCSVLQPKYANFIAAVCNLKICEFNLCLITTESLSDERVTVPRAAIDLPDFVAHFYVILEVQEEQEQVLIRGILRYDQLLNYRQSVNLQAQRDWSYQLPLSLFDAEPNHLLFYLRFLEPDAIALPVAMAHRPTRQFLTQAELETQLYHLQSPDRKLWQSLTWEQGAIVLTCPELLDLLYQWQMQPKETISLSIRIRELFTLLMTQAVNAACWLQGEMDEVAQSLGLFFPQTSSVFRSIAKFEAAIAELKQQGMEIPMQAGRTYQDINLDGIPLRLCALTWSVTSQLSSRKWSLLLILGTQTGNPLPDDLKLQVSNLVSILREAVSELDDRFLFAHVEGDWSETFVVTIVPSDRSPMMLAPYTFEPEQAL